MCRKNKFKNIFVAVIVIITLSHFSTGQYPNSNEEFNSDESKSENDSKKPIKIQLSRRLFYCEDKWYNESSIPQKWCRTHVRNMNILPCVNPCRNQDGSFPTRRCELINNVATWSEVENPCDDYDNLPVITTFLNTIPTEMTPYNFNNVFTKIQIENSTLSELDIDLLANILNNVSNQTTQIEYTESFFGVINNLLYVNQSVLRNSRKFGSTDKIVKSIDNFVISLSKEITTYSVNLTNIALEIIKPNNTTSDDHYNITLNNVHAKIPNEHLNTSILTIFKSNNLFPEGNVVSEIADLKILGVNGTLNNPISLYLHVDPSIEVICSFWKFNEKENGNWSSDGVQTIRLSDDLVECKSDHLTAFVLLGISDRVIESLSMANQLALQIISTILCSFSLAGLIVILITCFALKKWYVKRINTIKISVVITLEIVLIFLNDLITIEDGLGCKFFGIFMHYLVLVKFVVMLLIAKTQYENFVTVLTSRNKSRNFLISAFLAFSIPIVIVGISAGIFPEHYNPGNVNFCYPKAEAFKYFLIIPIALILMVNIIIFSLVMFYISNSISRDNKQKMLQAKLAAMLFFMLGITWIFSVFSHMVFTPWLQLVFIYTFAILSPLQGFAIFVFAIVFDSDAKTFWLDCCKKLRYRPVSTEDTKNTTSTAVTMSSVTQSDDQNLTGTKKTKLNSFNNN